MGEAKLGEQMRVLVMSVIGEISEVRGIELVEDVIKAIGMEKAPGNLMSRYPVEGTKGGNGFTYFQPITESFITFDAWPDLNGGYLVICSCGKLPLKEVYEVLKKYDLESKQFNYIKIGLV
jgi:hypothetical protein